MAIALCLTKSQVCSDAVSKKAEPDLSRESAPPVITPTTPTDAPTPTEHHRRRRPALSPLRMCAFEPRPFPPRELSDVPVNYVIDQLRRLAPNYWGKTDTADCTLVIPITRIEKANSGEYVNARRALDTGRRATEPALPNLPPLVLRLHSDYLSANSTLLRTLFGGISPIDLINSSQPMPPSMTLLPRVLPSSSENHPQLFLPVPDPSSMRFIIHWCYFREFRYIASYLDRGVLSWDGIVRNVQYLGLDQELKDDLSRYIHHPSKEDMLISPVSSAASDSEGDADCEDSDSSADSEDVEMDMDYVKESPGVSPLDRATSIYQPMPF